ncbi:MAG: HEAT repeat domain-containing protein [Planctomycetota bacterium]
MSEHLSTATLLKLVVSKDADVRADAERRLASEKRGLADASVESAVAVLVAALAQRDEVIARSAARWLIAIGAAAVPALRAALRNAPSTQLEHRVLVVLMQLGAAARPALPEIQISLRSSEHHICVVAAQALLAMGRPAAEVTSDLVLALDHWDADVKAAAARALAQLGVDAALREPAVVSKLIELLGHEADQVRHAAAGAVAALGEMAVPWLTSLIEHKDEQRVLHATARDRATAEEVAAADPGQLTAEQLRNWSWRVWQRLRLTKEPLLAAAVEALGRIDCRRDDVVKALGHAATDRNPVIQAQAIKALGQRGAQASSQIPILVELLAVPGAPPPAMILDSLDAILPDWARSSALEPTAAKLVERLKSSASRDAATKTLARIGAVALPALIAGLGHGDRVVREACAVVLQRIGSPARPAASRLAALAADEAESGFVREAARRALDSFGA